MTAKEARHRHRWVHVAQTTVDYREEWGTDVSYELRILACIDPSCRKLKGEWDQ